jgi:hypothetical protein
MSYSTDSTKIFVLSKVKQVEFAVAFGRKTKPRDTILRVQITDLNSDFSLLEFRRHRTSGHRI